MSTKYAIDLFSGAGGSTQAAKRYFNITTAIEIDPIFAKTYALNHGDQHLYIKDIQTTDENFWKKELNKTKNKSLDLLIATPPCQGFSKHSRTKVIESTDIRNNIILEVVRVAQITKPKYIFMENVTNIVNYKVFHRFLKRLSNIKKNGLPLNPDLPSYHIRFESVSAQDFNVPQVRKRMILIAKKIEEFPKTDAYVTIRNLTVPIIKKTLDVWPQKTIAPTLGEYLSKFNLSTLQAGEQCANDPLHRTQKLSDLNLERIKSTPLNGGSRNVWPDHLILECHKKSNVSFGDVYGRMNFNDYAPTITCGCSSYSKGRFGHPIENRAISLREAALIQTFPINYKFTGSIEGKVNGGAINKIATQIGNAIPVNLAEKFLKEIYYALE